MQAFDIERLGLNLGEAAATMIFGRSAVGVEGRWTLEAGAQTNDAYHLSAPSPDGDGVFRALSVAAEGISPDELDCISLHGTATMFNDQMESKAVQRAGLSDVPACALKGYYGHTLGAAGLVETIIMMESLEDGVVLPTRGFEELGVSGKISVSGEERSSAGKGRFIKVLSGFGGGIARFVIASLKRHPPCCRAPATLRCWVVSALIGTMTLKKYTGRSWKVIRNSTRWICFQSFHMWHPNSC